MKRGLVVLCLNVCFKKKVFNVLQIMFLAKNPSFKCPYGFPWHLLSLIHGGRFQEQGWLAVLTKCSAKISSSEVAGRLTHFPYC